MVIYLISYSYSYSYFFDLIVPVYFILICLFEYVCLICLLQNCIYTKLVYHSSPIPLMPLPSFDSVSSPIYYYNFIICMYNRNVNKYIPEQLNVFIINIFPSYFIDSEYDGFECATCTMCVL